MAVPSGTIRMTCSSCGRLCGRLIVTSAPLTKNLLTSSARTGGARTRNQRQRTFWTHASTLATYLLLCVMKSNQFSKTRQTRICSANAFMNTCWITMKVWIMWFANLFLKSKSMDWLLLWLPLQWLCAYVMMARHPWDICWRKWMWKCRNLRKTCSKGRMLPRIMTAQRQSLHATKQYRRRRRRRKRFGKDGQDVKTEGFPYLERGH